MSGDPEHSVADAGGFTFVASYKVTPVVGWFRRWNWRLHHRFGRNHWEMTDKQIRRELRAMSWRRAL